MSTKYDYEQAIDRLLCGFANLPDTLSRLQLRSIWEREGACALADLLSAMLAVDPTRRDREALEALRADAALMAALIAADTAILPVQPSQGWEFVEGGAS